MSEQEESPRNSVQVEQEKLLTVSHPGPSAWWFLGGTMAFVSVICLLPLMLIDDVGAGGWAFMAGLLVLCALFLLWCIKASRVSMMADASGIHLHTLTWVRTSIPWERVASVRSDSTGSGLNLGWKMLGGGTIGYLAGKGAVMIEISDGEKSHNLARRYLVSVPEPDLITLKLRELSP